MKGFLTLGVLLFAFAAKSQTLISADSMPVSGKLPYRLYNNAKLIGPSKKGTIYALPPDNMPALRPDTSIAYNMPVHAFKDLPYKFYTSTPQKENKRRYYQEPQWEDSIIQTPDGPKRIFIPRKNKNVHK